MFCIRLHTTPPNSTDQPSNLQTHIIASQSTRRSRAALHNRRHLHLVHVVRTLRRAAAAAAASRLTSGTGYQSGKCASLLDTSNSSRDADDVSIEHNTKRNEIPRRNQHDTTTKDIMACSCGGGALLAALSALALAGSGWNCLATASTTTPPAPAAATPMIVDTQLDRFRIRDICGAANRNLRLYLDYGDGGWVTGYARTHQLEHMVDDFAVSAPPVREPNVEPNAEQCAWK